MKQQMTKTVTRPSADKKRELILKTAAKLFAKQGFAATSMNQIAAKAKINKSLIFHHFKDKANLWKMVKVYFLEKMESKVGIKADDLYQDTREKFIAKLCEIRFQFLETEPDAARMMLWQDLEDQKAALGGTSNFTFDKLITHIEHLQKSGEITSQYPSHHVLYLLTQTIHAGLFSAHSHFKSKEDRRLYLSNIIKALDKALS